MIELGQLEAAHEEFRGKARVVVISIEDQDEAKETKKDFPHLVVVADADRKLAEAIDVIHRQSAPGGKDTSAPTTIITDGKGIVRWTYRPDRFLTRLNPAEVLGALNEHLPKE